ncbi:MAG: glycosyl hydrolase 2 galactose-binding domain-containing protein [Solirubrobacteraceae bacterium]
MRTDILEGAHWTCGATAPGAVEQPGLLDQNAVQWIPATVPGTAAGAMREAGHWTWGNEDESALDGRDWWFRCGFAAPTANGPWELALGGIATIADVWLNGGHLLRSDNMFLAHRLVIERLELDNELVIRCRALGPLLAGRHRRPRWKSRLVRAQSLRWYRTTLMGRMPGWSAWGAPVGPWRAVTLTQRDPAGAVANLSLQATAAGAGGTIDARVVIECAQQAPREAWIHAGGQRARLTLTADAGISIAHGRLELVRVERWWPHTHGPQPLYDVELELDGRRRPLRRVGFRTIGVDRSGDGFQLLINGIPVFCRGAVWGPPDAISFAATEDQVRASLQLAVEAGMNMLRVAGYGTYEDAPFWDACDELGVMVWQDCMLASVDPPEDPAFVAALELELRQAFGALGGRPSLTVACGSSECYQQASMFGLPAESWRIPLLEEAVPAILASVVPGIPYVPSSPFGGDPPFTTDVGVCHYFGVGAYLRPITDAWLAGVRFASEGLVFGTPPERETVDEVFGGPHVAGHGGLWKRAAARDDDSTAWDFEEIAVHYVRELFGVDPFRVRYSDPERALDLVRAAVAELIGTVMSGWRRPSSTCAGALVLAWRDLWPGPGWGLIDALGRPKASYYALRRALAPTAVRFSDDGLAGLRLTVYNDGPERLRGTARIHVHADTGAELEIAEREVDLVGHDTDVFGTATIFGGFRDLNNAYRFTPLRHDIVVADLLGQDGRRICQAVHLADGAARPRLPDVGLTARTQRVSDGSWCLTVSSRLFAQYVVIDVPGFRPSDSWFHLPPGESVQLALYSDDDDRAPAGTVRALNAGAAVRIAR